MQFFESRVIAISDRVRRLVVKKRKKQLGVYESFSPKANVQGWNATFLPVERQQPVIFK
jgi:hypothetical protein